MIGTEEVWHFIAFGFLPLPGLLTRDEALTVRAEIERLGRERGQVPDDTAGDGESGGIGARKVSVQLSTSTSKPSIKRP